MNWSSTKNYSESQKQSLLRHFERFVLRNPFIPVKPSLKQAEFLMCPDREVLYGGAAGGGKTIAMMMAALMYVEVPGYSALILRKSYNDIAQPGCPIPISQEWLRGTGAVYSATKFMWTFPSGATLSFGYLQNEFDKYRYQGCFTPDTEVLTLSGWVNITEVSKGDMVASLDPETRIMEYKQVSDTWVYDYSGDLITLNQIGGVSFKVTPNHTIWASTHRVNKLRQYSADSIPATAKIPQWFRWDGEKVTKPIVFSSDGNNGKTISFTPEQWMRFLGWYLSEGCCSTKRSKRHTITLTQKTEPGRTMIRNHLNDCGLTFQENYKSFRFNNKALCEYLRQFGHSGDKFIPRDVLGWDRQLLQHLLDSIIQGDGTWRDQNHINGHFVTSSTKLKDDVMEVALKCGYRATACLRQGNSPDSKFGTKPRWHLSIHRTEDDTYITSCSNGVNYSTKRERYNGKVYCVTVPPHHTVLIRHNNRVSWSGQSVYQFVGWDELTQHTESSYLYLFSRCRKPERLPIPLRIRATSNPGGIGHEWVKLRFLDTPHPGRVFIPAGLKDNPHLDAKTYIENLSNLDSVTRKQLLDGDWSARESGGKFRREWFDPIVDGYPKGTRVVRFWDMAGTKPAKGKDPDYTVGVAMTEKDGVFYIIDVQRARGTPQEIESLVKTTAEMDASIHPHLDICMEREPGSSGVNVVDHYARNVLKGFSFYAVKSTGDKELRANPMSAAAEARNIRLVRGKWLLPFIDELEAFPNGSHDDQVDAASGAFTRLARPKGVIIW